MKTEVRNILKELVEAKDICIEKYGEFVTLKDPDTLLKLIQLLYTEGKITTDGAMLLVEYVEEERGNNTLKLPGTNPVYPVQPYSFPTYPNNPGSTDPYPWQLPQVWCSNATYSTQPNIERMSYQINS